MRSNIGRMADTPVAAPSAQARYLSVLMNPVESSNLDSIGYNAETRVLAVLFKSGALHHYQDVPPDLWADFWDSLSKGQFYSMNVRGKFTGDKLTGECPKCGSKPGLIGETCVDCGCATYAGECGAEGPDGVRCTKVQGHEAGDDDGAEFHGRGKKTWKRI